MKMSLAIGLLLSCALAVHQLPAQTAPQGKTLFDVGSPPTEQVAIDSSFSATPVLYAVNTSVDNSDYETRKPVVDTATTNRQPEGPSANAHKPAQDDHPTRPRVTLAHQPKHQLPALPDRLPALHLSQTWSIPHRLGQLHRITHY